jgi:acyl-CoA synthetase (NDP forming)
LSTFVSTGDKADLSGNDFLQFWEGDPATRVVLLYLESLGNPRRFATIARRVASAKPIVAVKSGRAAGTRAAAETRTSALLGASEVPVDALFEHAAVIRTDTVAEQLDVAAMLATQPLPAGDRVVIVSNGRGPAVSCADACVVAGLQAAEPVDPDAAAAVIAHALARGEGWLEPAETEALLAAYGVPTGTTDGVELVAGVVSDPDFGPIVACGLGGPTAELLADVAVRLAPLTPADAGELVRSLRSFPLLDGHRGAPKADRAALEELVSRLSALAAAHPEVVEVDCDPVMAGPEGAAVTAARVRVRPAAAPRPFPALDR